MLLSRRRRATPRGPFLQRSVLSFSLEGSEGPCINSEPRSHSEDVFAGKRAWEMSAGLFFFLPCYTTRYSYRETHGHLGRAPEGEQLPSGYDFGSSVIASQVCRGGSLRIGASVLSGGWRSSAQAPPCVASEPTSDMCITNATRDTSMAAAPNLAGGIYKRKFLGRTKSLGDRSAPCFQFDAMLSYSLGRSSTHLA
jgi:hypothetical protein